MMGWWTGDGGGWMIVMMLAWVSLVGLGIWAVVALTRAPSRPTPVPEGADAILDRRLAAGEITIEEYRRLRTELRGRAG